MGSLLNFSVSLKLFKDQTLPMKKVYVANISAHTGDFFF